MFIVYFLHLGALIFRNITEMYSTAILTKTPPVVLAGILALLSAWLVRAGLEPLARTAEPLATIVGVVVLGLVVLRFATPGLTHTRFLFPVLEHGIRPVARHALVVFAFPFAELVAFLFLIPATAHPERSGVFLGGALLAGALLLNLVFLASLFSFGPTELSRLNFPCLVSIQQIQLGQFFQRIEVLGILVWTSGSFVKLAVCHYVVVLGIAELFSLEDPRPAAAPLAALMATLSIAVYSNVAEMTTFALRTYPIYAPVIEVGLPLVMLVVAVVRGKRGIPRRAADTVRRKR